WRRPKRTGPLKDFATVLESWCPRQKEKRRQSRLAKCAVNEYSERSDCIRWKFPYSCPEIHGANRGPIHTGRREWHRISVPAPSRRKESTQELHTAATDDRW